MSKITPLETFVFNGKEFEIALASRLGYPEGVPISLPFVSLSELPIFQDGHAEPQNLLLFLNMGGFATYQMSAMVAASLATRMLESIFLNSRIKIAFTGQWLDRLLRVREDMMEIPEAEFKGLPGTPDNPGSEEDLSANRELRLMIDSLCSTYAQQRTLTEGHAFYMKYRDTPGALARDFAQFILQTIGVEKPEEDDEEEEAPQAPKTFFETMMSDPIFFKIRNSNKVPTSIYARFCQQYIKEGKPAAIAFLKEHYPDLEID